MRVLGIAFIAARGTDVAGPPVFGDQPRIQFFLRQMGYARAWLMQASPFVVIRSTNHLTSNNDQR